MSHYRDAMEANMRQWLTAPLPKPVIDLGGREWRAWMVGIIGAEHETWDMLPGPDVTRVIDAQRMKGVPDATIGTVISTSTFEHIANPWQAAAHVARIMRPGGLLYIHTPFAFEYHECPGDYWRFAPQALRVLFGENYDEVACDWVGKPTPGANFASFFVGRRKPTSDEGEAIRVAQLIPGLIPEEAELRFLYRMAVLAPLGGEFVELGAFKGRSCSVLCHAAGLRGQIPYSIDDYSYMVPSSPEIVRKNLHVFGLAAHVIKSDSRKPPEGLGAVSFLFIDSYHIAEHFKAEAAAWLPLVINGGIVVCHDYQGTKWKEMKAAIDGTFGAGWKKLGKAQTMIAFRRV